MFYSSEFSGLALDSAVSPSPILKVSSGKSAGTSFLTVSFLRRKKYIIAPKGTTIFVITDRVEGSAAIELLDNINPTIKFNLADSPKVKVKEMPTHCNSILWECQRENAGIVNYFE